MGLMYDKGFPRNGWWAVHAAARQYGTHDRFIGWLAGKRLTMTVYRRLGIAEKLALQREYRS